MIPLTPDTIFRQLRPMDPFRPLSTSEQLTEHLRRQILRGHLSDTLPGIKQIVRELGVNSTAVTTAVKQLEREGLLLSQGDRRSRRVARPKHHEVPSLRIQILLYEESDGKRHYIVDLVHRLLGAGHQASLATRSLFEMKMSLSRVKRFVTMVEADAWIVFAGSREILEWFAGSSMPAFALSGRRRSVKIAGCGPDKATAQRDIVQRLFELGHRRIVFLAREERRHPRPAHFEQTFLDALESHGISTGSYNLPDWQETPEGLCSCLHALFGYTPPTAVFVEEMPLFVATQNYLAECGFLTPRNVSLICGDPDPAFDWCRAGVAHIQWDSRPLVRRILKWAANVALGKDDRNQSSIRAEFIDGGTVGPAPGRQARATARKR